MGRVLLGRRTVLSAELVEEPGRERLESPADAVLAGERDSEPGGQDRGEEGRGHSGGLNEGLSVAARPLREVDGVPAVCREVQELDLTEEGRGHRGKREAPCGWVGTEFDAGENEAEPVDG
jgi:hypothetical protein